MIAIVDYGMGNLRSVQRALERAGASVSIVTAPAELARADKIVLPGVAAFGDAIAQLRRQALDEPIVRALREGTPFLGFCLGLQLLFEVSYEGGEHRGLGVLPGKVVRFRQEQLSPARAKVPHIGWNQIDWRQDVGMLAGVPRGSYVYFDHSYHVVPTNDELTATWTEHGYRFASSVWSGNIFATQFHPEKSQGVGLKILENFVKV